MSSRRVILYWLLLMVPALALGIGGFILLGHERQRLARADEVAASEAATLLSRELALAVREVEAEVRAGLRRVMGGPDRREGLREWERRDPLVRNVFLWRSPNRLAYPDPLSPATQEQAAFVQRYEALFSGRLPWPESDSGAADEISAPRRLSKSQTVAAGGGRLPWYWENRLHVLLWEELPYEDGRLGVEVEMMTLLARVLPLIDGAGAGKRILQVQDGQGRVIWHAGGADVPVEAEALSELARLPVGEVLPHWYVAVYRLPGELPGATGFYALSVLLLGIFVLALVLGGSLLLWQARLQALEARRKSTFVSNVSHELKTPLTSIRMYAELLHEGRVSSEEKRQRYLGILVDEAQRLTRLVNNVLDFSRLDQGRKQYEPRPLAPGALIEAVLATVDMRLEQAALRVEVLDEAGAARMLGDRDACEQVLLNLVDNAIKYARAGGEVRIVARVDGRGMELAVEDRGPGIAAGDAGRIFEAFTRVDESLTTQGSGGTGLGLSIARRLLRDQGGDLRHEAREGGGARFIMRLPLAEEE